jgi:hypothetical protein
MRSRGSGKGRQRSPRKRPPPKGEREALTQGERRNLLPGGNEPFTCVRCAARVLPLQNGSVRNHCPECLGSVHVDRVPGDRSEGCGGFLQPVGIEGTSAAGFTIVFRCLGCGAIRRNRAAADDPVQPDRWEALVALSGGAGGGAGSAAGGAATRGAATGPKSRRRGRPPKG